MRGDENDDANVDDEGEEVSQANADLIRERGVDDLKVGTEPVEDAPCWCGVEIPEWRVGDSGQSRYEQHSSCLKASVVGNEDSDDRNEQVDKTWESIRGQQSREGRDKRDAQMRP